ncbi:MAG: hypothetical protein V7K40_20235 [Nostoc sp.]|uniref:hypothetical protein n=1 Tax=Nostoc sp. TaxID=1180 RepID=UPI002FF6496C
MNFRFQIQPLRVTLLRTLVPRYRFANATAPLTAVTHGVLGSPQVKQVAWKPPDAHRLATALGVSPSHIGRG